MELRYEIMAILLTGLVAFFGGMRKAKSTCCCCSLDFERDMDNKLQAVKVVRQNSMVRGAEEPTVPEETRKPWFASGL